MTNDCLENVNVMNDTYRNHPQNSWHKLHPMKFCIKSIGYTHRYTVHIVLSNLGKKPYM